MTDLPNLEEALARAVRKRRTQGLKVKKLWVRAKARELQKMPQLVTSLAGRQLKFSNSWYYRGFIPRSGFAIRRGSNRKQRPAQDVKQGIFAFHQKLDALYRTPPLADSQWGMSKRVIFNFDQVPLPFVCDADARTLDDKGATRVWCRQPGRWLQPPLRDDGALSIFDDRLRTGKTTGYDAPDHLR
jgi:hypothetical protein